MHFRECSLTLPLEREPVFCRLVLLINRGKAVCDVWESPPKSHTFSSICFSLGFDPLVCMCCGYWEWTGKFMRSLTWWALLALCIRFHHFMANRWGNSGNWLTLFFWAPKSLQTVIAAMKLKDAYSLGRKVMTNLDSIYKSTDITLPTKVSLVKGMVFPVVIYGYENWTIKKTERRRIDAFKLWCWRRLLTVSWTARKSNQSILKISPDCSLEGLILKLKLQYFGHLMGRADSFEKTPVLGKIEDRRRKGW